MKKTILAVALGLTAITAQADPNTYVNNQKFTIIYFKKIGIQVEKLDISSDDCHNLNYELMSNNFKTKNAFDKTWYQNSKGEYVSLSCLPATFWNPLHMDKPTLEEEHQLNVKFITTIEAIDNENSRKKQAQEDAYKAKQDKLKDLGLL